MANSNGWIGSQIGLDYVSAPFAIRIGTREISICRDFRKRFYSVNPVLDFFLGNKAGHLEILLFRRWLVILSKAR